MFSSGMHFFAMPTFTLDYHYPPFSLTTECYLRMEAECHLLPDKISIEDLISRHVPTIANLNSDEVLALRKGLAEHITDEQICYLITMLYKNNAPIKVYCSLAKETIWFSKKSKDASELKAFMRIITELTDLVLQAEDADEIKKINELTKMFCLQVIRYFEPQYIPYQTSEVYNAAIAHIVYMLTSNKIVLDEIDENSPLQIFFSDTEEDAHLKRVLEAYYLLVSAESANTEQSTHERKPESAADKKFIYELKSYCHEMLSVTSIQREPGKEHWLPKVRACYPFYVLYKKKDYSAETLALCKQTAMEMTSAKAGLSMSI